MMRLLPLLFVYLVSTLTTFAGTPAQVDLLIRNARIIDGAGNPWFRGDVAVRGDSIAAVGQGLDVTAKEVIDADGRVLSPGFIDLHTHARRGIFEVPSADNYVRQGVTTIFEGPDGSSPIPIGAFLEKVADARPAVNLGTFVGQGSVRSEVIGRVDRKATPEEIERMREIVRRAMEEGAFGLSTGLFYVPGTFTPTDEVIELAKVAGAMGGIHISHMRSEGDELLESVRETIEIGEKGNFPTQITHHKAMGKKNWGKSAEALRLVHEARARSVDVTSDQYPYTASSTGIAALLPHWALEGTREERAARLADPETRARIRAFVIENLRENRGGGDLRNIQIARADWDASLAGKDLGEITRAWKGSTDFAAAADVVLEIMDKGGAQAIYHAMSEEDVERILADPLTMIASDGEVPVFGRSSPHPRSYGTFARVLGRYVRERKVITLPDAIRKMTSLPAQRVGLADRGILRPGMKADLVLFDPATVRDRATFTEPHQYAEGFSLVVVNGEVVFRDGSMTDARPGRVLHGPAWSPASEDGSWREGNRMQQSPKR